MLTQLIEDHQDIETEEAKSALLKWNAERDKLRYGNLFQSFKFQLLSKTKTGNILEKNFIFFFLSNFPNLSNLLKSFIFSQTDKPPNGCLISNLVVCFERTTIQHIFHDDCSDFLTFIPVTYRI